MLKNLVILIAIAGFTSLGSAGPLCAPAGWFPACNGGTPTLQGNPYYACSGGVFRCCWYLVQNHGCQYPPPATGKYMTLVSEDPNAQCSEVEGCIPK